MSFGIKKSLSSLAVCALLVFGLFSSWTSSIYAVTNLVFSDEFNGAGTNVDTTKWGFDLGNTSSIAGGGWGNNEKETYSAAAKNAFVSNGVLHIVALNDVGGGAPYSSARLRTLGLFSLTYGRIEVRARLPRGSPYWWPAIWMLATNYSGTTGPTNSWPECGEIDMVESKGATPLTNFFTLHKDGAGNQGVDISAQVRYTFPSGDANTNFHTYVTEWNTNSFHVSIDSNTVLYSNGGTINNWSSSIGPFPAPFNHPFYIIMNLAVGGNFVGNPGTATINAATTFPGDMQIDYIRVYQDGPAPPLGPPLLLSVAPSNGCASGGTAITLTGTNFQNTATVTINGVNATAVTVVNTNTITAITGANAAGTYNIVLKCTNQPPTTLTNGFTYLGPPLFAGPGTVTPAVEGATLTWSAASGSPPFTYGVYEATNSGGEINPLLTTNALSAFISLYPGSNSPITYFFKVKATDTCSATDTNQVELSVQPLLNPNSSQVGDGIPNGWKQQYGFSPFDNTVAAADPDGDDLSNLQEFQLGTNPLDNNSPFHVTAVTLQGSDVLVSWQSVGGMTSAVESTPALGGSYSNISGNIIITGSGLTTTNYLDPGAVTNAPLQFYRIRLIP
ncbi:MAG TPA: family 16 glycosylhydrolase [Verrucomicrobiae bacterium]|nr:family 16 glycosylhydrolase [Verrucomicrobiae bacterium]